jgi:hypothetical protein
LGFVDGDGRDLAPIANCDAVVISVYWMLGIERLFSLLFLAY